MTRSWFSRSLVILAVAAVLAAPASAGVNRLTGDGPAGGDVTAVAIHPLNPLVAWALTADRGPFKSTDGGVHWTYAGGIEGWEAGAEGLVVDPQNADRVWVWGHELGLRRTTNGGSAWSQLILWGVESLAMDATTPNTLFAVTGGAVQRSLNGGDTWTAVDDPGKKYKTGATPRRIVADPVTHHVIYAAGTGVYRSVNGGDDWTRLDGGDMFEQILGDRMAVAATTPRTLWVFDIYNLLRRSLDDGQTWTIVATPTTDADVGVVTVDPAHPGTLFLGGNTRDVWGNPSRGGLWKTTDNGSTWAGLATKVCQGLAIHPNSTELLLGTVPEGVLRSTNGGNSWTVSNAGLTNTRVECLAADPSGSGSLLAGVQGAGVLRSPDGSSGWAALGGGPSDLRLIVVEAAPTGALYAGTDGGGVFRRDAGGGSWSAASSGLVYLGVNAIAVDPFDVSHLWNGTCRMEFVFFTGGAAVTTDGALNWAPRFIGPTWDLAFDPFTEGTVYACTTNGFMVTVDGGDSWLPTSPLLETVAPDPGTPGTLYGVIPSVGVLKSVDGGENWRELREACSPDAPWRDVLSAALDAEPDPLRPGVVYLRTAELGTWVSGDGGCTWTGVGVSYPLAWATPAKLAQTVCLAAGAVWPGGVAVGTPRDGAAGLSVDPYDLDWDTQRTAADRQGLADALAAVRSRVPGPLACGDMDGDRKTNAVDLVLMARATP